MLLTRYVSQRPDGYASETFHGRPQDAVLCTCPMSYMTETFHANRTPSMAAT